MDEDGNKKLNQEEFKTGLQETDIDLEDNEITEIFQKFDTDEDGNISVDEFLVGIRVSVLAWRIVYLGAILFFVFFRAKVARLRIYRIIFHALKSEWWEKYFAQTSHLRIDKKKYIRYIKYEFYKI